MDDLYGALYLLGLFAAATLALFAAWTAFTEPRSSYLKISSFAVILFALLALHSHLSMHDYRRQHAVLYDQYQRDLSEIDGGDVKDMQLNADLSGAFFWMFAICAAISLFGSVSQGWRDRRRRTFAIGKRLRSPRRHRPAQFT